MGGRSLGSWWERGDLLRERKKEVAESIVWEWGWWRVEEKKGKEVVSLEEGVRGNDGLLGLVDGVVVVEALVEELVVDDVARRDIDGRCEDMVLSALKLTTLSWILGGFAGR